MLIPAQCRVGWLNKGSIMLTSKITVTAIAELKKAGWNFVGSVMKQANAGFAYGLLFTKDGKKFYFNKDTYVSDWSADTVAEMCLPLFNK